jgi:hypothetical protein
VVLVGHVPLTQAEAVSVGVLVAADGPGSVVRDAGSKQILHEAVHTGFGDATVFRLASHLQHRVTEVEGLDTKTAFAAWFRSQPDYLSALKENSQFA